MGKKMEKNTETTFDMKLLFRGFRLGFYLSLRVGRYSLSVGVFPQMQVQVLLLRYHLWMLCRTGVFLGTTDIKWPHKEGWRNAIWRVCWQAGFLDAMSLHTDD